MIERETTTVEKFNNGLWVGANNHILKRLDDEYAVFYKSTHFGRTAGAAKYSLFNNVITIEGELSGLSHESLRELTDQEQTFIKFADRHNSIAEDNLAKEFGVDSVLGLTCNSNPIIGVFADMDNGGVFVDWMLTRTQGNPSLKWDLLCGANKEHIKTNVKPEPPYQYEDFGELNTVGELFEWNGRVHLITEDFMFNGRRRYTVVSRDGLAATYDEYQFKCFFRGITPATQIQKEQFYRGLELEHHGEIGEVTFTSNSIIFVPYNNQPFTISESALRDMKLRRGGYESNR